MLLLFVEVVICLLILDNPNNMDKDVYFQAYQYL
jgi:hypothetical protein